MEARYYCEKCHTELELDQKPCPVCGSSERLAKQLCSGEVGMTGTLRGRTKREGFKKFVKEVITGSFPSKNKADFPKGVDIDRTIDREKGEYHQVVRDKQTGKITHEEHESLDQHSGRRHNS